MQFFLYSFLTNNEVVELLRKANGPPYPARTTAAYSNTAYVLLALIVERVSGTKFDMCSANLTGVRPISYLLAPWKGEIFMFPVSEPLG